MVKVINPKVTVVSYGPELKLKNGVTITPDEFVYGASGITYKGMGSVDELMKLKLEDVDFSDKMLKSIIKSAGAGHASLATTPGFWAILEGNSSKLVDSIFTGATFSSSLMPSGRRVPICQEEIVVPKGIHEAGKDAENIYLKVLSDTIQAYEFLQTKGVSKQEASKIVPYGHSGGGFVFMPLETLIHFSKLAEKNPLAMPEEGKEIISQLETFLHKHGMGATYEARKEAPRTGCVNPNIFQFEKNFTEEEFEKSQNEICLGPKLLALKDLPSKERTRRIEEYFKHKEEMLKDTEHLWRKSLGELEGIINDFNDTTRVQLIESVSWRVWGEIKRHRTLSHTPESIYHAVDKASAGISNPFQLQTLISTPESVLNDKENLGMWTKSFTNAIHAYDQLVKNGIKKSDAIALIPRGIKLAVIKDFDLYNMTTGYISLRLCNTCEPEMRKTTELERGLIRSLLENDVRSLISPKCHYGGFCPEASYKTCCGKINQVAPEYNEEKHKAVWEYRENQIKDRIKAKN
jgi:thymidylate synthase ThyX